VANRAISLEVDANRAIKLLVLTKT